MSELAVFANSYSVFVFGLMSLTLKMTIIPVSLGLGSYMEVPNTLQL